MKDAIVRHRIQSEIACSIFQRRLLLSQRPPEGLPVLYYEEMAAHLWADTCAADAFAAVCERRGEMTLARWHKGKAQLYGGLRARSQAGLWFTASNRATFVVHGESLKPDL